MKYIASILIMIFNMCLIYIVNVTWNIDLIGDSVRVNLVVALAFLPQIQDLLCVCVWTHN